MSVLDEIGVYSDNVTFNVHLYDYSSFEFGLETKLDLYSSVTKFSKFEILDMRLAKSQFGQSICSFSLGITLSYEELNTLVFIYAMYTTTTCLILHMTYNSKEVNVM